MQIMASAKLKMAVAVAAVLSGTVVAVGCGALRAAGANGLLHPGRRVLDATLREAHPQVTFAGADVTLSGWKFPAKGARRGSIVYLHGIADNRGSGLSPALRFSARGFDVVGPDSRAHGDSTGGICTFGFYEKRDLQRVIDVLESGPVIVIGSSLGGAVALQAAAEDERISAVVAAESFWISGPLRQSGRRGSSRRGPSVRPWCSPRNRACSKSTRSAPKNLRGASACRSC